MPRLLAISDRRSLPGGDLGAWLRELGRAGVDGCQIREKDLSDRALLDLVGQARALLPGATALLVNRRLDVALAAGADGVHLPQDGLPIAPLRARFGARLLIGRSTHSVADVERARDEGADYATFGPIADTPSKRAYGPPVGIAALERAARLGLPLLALGGVRAELFPRLAAAGAAGVAGIRVFQDPADLAALAAAAATHFERPAAQPA